MSHSPAIGWRVPLLVVCLLVGAVTLLAEVERRTGETVVVTSGEVVPDDLYATGEVVRIDGTVRGDLVAVAREVIIAGTVEGDVIAAGQAISIRGTVGDDARVAGQVIQVADGARIADDLVVAGFSVEAEAGSSIGGAVLVAGYQAIFAGEVAESLRGALGALALAGTVRGDVDVDVGPAGERTPPMFGPPPPLPIPTVASGLGLADGSRIGGDLRYASPDTARIASGAEVAGEVVHEPKAGRPAPTAGDRALDAVRRLAALLILGALFLLVVPGWFAGLATTVRERPLPSLGWGLVALAAAIAAALVLAFVVVLVAGLFGVATLTGLAVVAATVGILAEIVLACAVIFTFAYLAAAVVGLAGGRLAVARGGETSRGRLFAALAVGAALLVAVGLVPYLGGLVGFLVGLLGLGALWLWGADRLRAARRLPA